MIVVREPVLHPVAITDLRPTQITVGMREVQDKRERLRKHPQKKIGRFLGGHMIPVIRGPKDRMYVVHHHHLALALHHEGVRDILVSVVADLSELSLDAFWTVLDHRSWVHPYDAEGRRRTVRDIPKSVVGLKDDPFRSLAGELRRAGGFAIQRIPLGRFPAAANEAQARSKAIPLCCHRGAETREEPGGSLPSGLVRTERRLGYFTAARRRSP